MWQGVKETVLIAALITIREAVGEKDDYDYAWKGTLTMLDKAWMRLSHVLDTTLTLTLTLTLIGGSVTYSIRRQV